MPASLSHSRESSSETTYFVYDALADGLLGEPCLLSSDPACRSGFLLLDYRSELDSLMCLQKGVCRAKLLKVLICLRHGGVVLQTPLLLCPPFRMVLGYLALRLGQQLFPLLLLCQAC